MKLFKNGLQPKKNYIATAEAHVKIISNGKKRVFQKKGWTIMDKFKENNHPTCKK